MRTSGFFCGYFHCVSISFPSLNLEAAKGVVSFGRVRPLHTSAVIFGFCGNALLAASFYIVQRTTAARLWGGNLAYWVFWGYQAFLVTTAVGYLLGNPKHTNMLSQSGCQTGYCCPFDPFLMVFLGTLFKRREPHIYVANWFLLAFILTVAILHVFNNLSIPVTCWLQVCFRFCGCARRNDSVVVWPQCCRLFVDSGFPWFDVLFYTKESGLPVYS